MPTPIPAPGTHFITLETFNTMKKMYADNSQLILAPAFQNKEVLITSETFNMDLLTAISAVTNAAGFRIYYGMDTNKKVHAMLVAVDKAGNDLLPAANSAKFAPNITVVGGGVAGEEGQRCPPAC